MLETHALSTDVSYTGGMTLTEKIFSHVESLPETYKAQVLDFVEFLASKSRKLQQPEDEERAAWSRFSLAQAAKGMEDEPDLYTPDDLAEAY